MKKVYCKECSNFYYDNVESPTGWKPSCLCRYDMNEENKENDCVRFIDYSRRTKEISELWFDNGWGAKA